MPRTQLAVLLALLVLLPLPAGAAPPAESEDAVRARQLFREGKARFEAGAYADALLALEPSLELVQAPETLLIMAHSHRLLGQDDKALERYGLYLAEWEARNPGQPAPEAAEIDGHIATLRERLAGRDAERAQARQQAEAEEVRRAQALKREREREQKERRARAARREQQRQLVVDKRRRVLRIVAVSSAALAASGLFAGAAFYGASDSAQHDESFASARRVSIASFVLSGIGAAGAATAGVLYLLAGRREKRAPSASAMVGPIAGGAAVTASVRF